MPVPPCLLAVSGRTSIEIVVIVLRPWRPDDAAALREADQSTPDLQTQFGGIDLSSDDLAEQFIRDVLLPRRQQRNWVIDDDGRLLGSVGLSAIESRHKTAWASYWLTAGARGQGHATRALTTAASWAFQHATFRIELGHRTNNPASCNVATRAGFITEGLERQKLQYGQQRFDVELHARLRTDPMPSGIELLRIVSARSD